MSKEDYLEKYKDYKIPASLKKLIEYSVERDLYLSAGFELEPNNIKYMYESYSSEKEFTESFICIGSADCMGSEYAFWVKNNNNLTNAPIIEFGGEGGYQIVANNFDELIRILTFDTEPMIDWDGIEFYKDEDDYEPSENIDEFHAWVKANLGLQIINTSEEINEIISKAQEVHQAELKSFVGQFYEE